MRLILFFLLFSLGADAQIIRANAFYRPTAAAATFLLDDYPNAAAAYSLRKLKSSYSGSAIRIRRDSTGNAETDIGFTVNGDLDTAAIKNHCRNNSCMVTTWYNQGDSSAVNFTQTTAASQPRIMTSGVIERRLGEPTIRFDNSGTTDRMAVSSSTVKFNYLHKSGQAAVFAIWQAGLVTNPAANYTLINNNNNGNISQIGYALGYIDAATNNTIFSIVTNGTANVSTQSPQNYFTADTLKLITNILDNNNATAGNRNILYINGTNEQKINLASSTPSTSNATNNLTLGINTNLSTAALNGFVSELILYPTDQSSNRTGIETNINSYYGLW